jgi:hypothetical protein
MITVATSAVDGEPNRNDHGPDHYGRHDGTVFAADTDYAPNAKNWGDIIPPVGNHDGLNWDEAGRAIYENGCNLVTVTDDEPVGRGGGSPVTPDETTVDEPTVESVDTQETDAPARLPNTGVSLWLTLVLPAIAAIPAYPLLRNKS